MGWEMWSHLNVGMFVRMDLIWRILLMQVSLMYSGTSLTQTLWDQRVFELVKCSSYRTHDVISLMCTLYTHYITI